MPERTIRLDPLRHGLEWRGGDLIDPLAPVPSLSHQTGAAEDAKMLGDRRSAHSESGRQFAHGRPTPPQAIENRAPGGVCHGMISIRVSTRTGHLASG